IPAVKNILNGLLFTKKRLLADNLIPELIRFLIGVGVQAFWKACWLKSVIGGFEPAGSVPNQFVPLILRKLSWPMVCELPPPLNPISKLFPVASFVKISMFAPATSPEIPGFRVLFTLMFWITSVPKKSKDTFLYNGFSDGNGKPFNEVEL